MKWDRLSRRRSRMAQARQRRKRAEASTLFRFVYPVTNRVGGGEKYRGNSIPSTFLAFPGSGVSRGPCVKWHPLVITWCPCPYSPSFTLTWKSRKKYLYTQFRPSNLELRLNLRYPLSKCVLERHQLPLAFQSQVLFKYN